MIASTTLYTIRNLHGPNVISEHVDIDRIEMTYCIKCCALKNFCQDIKGNWIAKVFQHEFNINCFIKISEDVVISDWLNIYRCVVFEHNDCSVEHVYQLVGLLSAYIRHPHHLTIR